MPKIEWEQTQRVPKRILTSLLASVSAGVVPRAGAPYIAIGRTDEIGAFLSDLEAVSEGGGGMRFLIGRYGSGKSFLMQLIRGYALERDFVTADADLSPERRLYGSGGSGVATYRELMKNLASKASPDGGALPKILARWLSSLQGELIARGKHPDDADFSDKLRSLVFEKLREMEFFVGGFDFSHVITAYFEAWNDVDDTGAEERKSACLRWLRGEFSNKTEARAALGFHVSIIIDDDNCYDFLKLWAALVRLMGYRGLVVFIDECVNLYKIVHRVSRENNYEKILSMFNDTLQGRAPGLELVLGGTPQFLEDTRRGLFSYEALRSRLCDSRFSTQGYKNLIGPVIRLRRLSDDELLALIVRITHLHSQNYGWDPRITMEQMQQFLQLCLSRAGADSMITPREMLRDYMTVLHILMQNEGVSFEEVLGSAVTLKTERQEREEQAEAPASAQPAAAPYVNFRPEDIDF
ncbi:MAG: biotin carboxylase [Ruminococcaceae bacterium]|nr:biotin carboxylase [Oscillospiraceae bacterium]